MWNRKSSEGNPGNSSDSNSITEGFHFYYFKVILSLKTSEVPCVCPVRLRLSFQFSAGYSSSHRFTLIHFAPPGNGSHGRQQAHIYSPALEPPPACCCTISSFTCNQKKSNVSVCARVRVCVCSCEKKLQEPTRHRRGQSQILPLPLLLLSIHLLCFLLLHFLSPSPPVSSDGCIMKASPGNLLLRKDGWCAWGWVGGLFTLCVENVKYKMLQSMSTWWILN